MMRRRGDMECFHEQRRLFDMIADKIGTPPTVIDSDDMLWCEGVSIGKPALPIGKIFHLLTVELGCKVYSQRIQTKGYHEVQWLIRRGLSLSAGA